MIDTTQRATGAIFREPGIKDFRLERLPGVGEAMADLPVSFLVMPLDQIKIRYDQGPVPRCVASSECTAKAIEDFGDVGQWNQYDDIELYLASGGNGSTGISTDTALAYARDTGLLEPSGRRWKIAAYAFAPQNANEWRQTLAAALVSSGPCVIATQLPSMFGWSSNEVLTGAYHQMCLVGYEGLRDDDYAVFLNSWGSRFGNNGFVRLKWGYLEGGNFQSNYTYGYKLVDVKDFVTPTPPQPAKIEFDAIAGKMKGGNGSLLVWPESSVTADTLAKLKDKKVHIKEV